MAVNFSHSSVHIYNETNIASVGDSSFTTTALAKNGGEGYFDIQFLPDLFNFGTVKSVVVNYKAYGSRTGLLGSKAQIKIYYAELTGGFTQAASHGDVGRGSGNATSYSDTIYPPFSGSGGFTLRFKCINPIAAQTNTVYVSNISFTINFENATYTITLDPNGGSCPISFITRTSGSAIGTITEGEKNPTKAGYTFTYWAFKSGRECNDDYIVTGDLTLYAQYEVKLPPEFTSAEMIYGGKQISPENKVIAGQSFIISVAVT